VVERRPLGLTSRDRHLQSVYDQVGAHVVGDRLGHTDLENTSTTAQQETCLVPVGCSVTSVDDKPVRGLSDSAV
jgi:hypothetical protein